MAGRPALGVVGEGLVELGLEPPPDRSVVLGFGGDAANAAVMAALLGAPARIGGRVGDDALGRRLLDFWSRTGVDVAHVLVDPEGPTGIYANERGAEGLHRFDYHRRNSAGSRLRPGDLGGAFLEGLGAVHLTGVTLAVSASSRDAALAVAEQARASGIRVSLAVNHRPALGGDVALLREVAAGADLVFVSADEAQEVFGQSDAAALELLLGDAELVVSHGGGRATVSAGGRRWSVAALAVHVVDAAGAGDALAGAYLAARLAGATPHDALRRGVAAAGLSCRARGCALSYPTSDEVDRALATSGKR
jgi:2-dehydro-3-deoxygluconokinase